MKTEATFIQSEDKNNIQSRNILKQNLKGRLKPDFHVLDS